MDVTFVIPTLNSEKTLKQCLSSIVNQDYSRGKISVLIVDGGSTDRTIEIAKSMNATVILNQNRTAEAGKALGLRSASTPLIAFVDSDNALPHTKWLENMTRPFVDETIIASEVIRWELAGLFSRVDRYCALTGVNDPLSLFIGNYSRYSSLSGRWTGLPIESTRKEGYLLLILRSCNMPTMGANGFILRKSAIPEVDIGDYVFDIDLLCQLVDEKGIVRIAKVDESIIHFFAENIAVFAKKTQRRASDYFFYKNKCGRKYPWLETNPNGVLEFVFFCLLFLPLLLQVLKGYIRKRDTAWFFHIPASYITLFIYLSAMLRSRVSSREYRREDLYGRLDGSGR